MPDTSPWSPPSTPLKETALTQGGQGSGSPVAGSGTTPSPWSGLKSPPKIGLPIPGKPGRLRPPLGTTPQQVADKLKPGQQVSGRLGGKTQTIGKIDTRAPVPAKQPRFIPEPPTTPKPAILPAGPTSLKPPSITKTPKLPKVVGGGIIGTIAGLLVQGESVMPESFGDIVGGILFDQMFDPDSVQNQLTSSPDKKRKGRCPLTTNKAIDGTRCGGRAASIRGKTAGYEKWWGGGVDTAPTARQKLDRTRYGKGL
jgi:hypothetical protein